MANTFKPYPSGFMGAANAPQTRPMSDVDYFKRLISNSNHTGADDLTANAEINRIWAAYGDKLNFNNQKEFEDIIAVGSDAFGTFNLADWARVQVKSPYFSQQHALYIEETLSFLIDGAPRVFMIGTRQEIMSFHSQAPAQKNLTPFSEKLLGRYNGESIIHLWLSKKDGYADLVTALYFMFGLI